MRIEPKIFIKLLAQLGPFPHQQDKPQFSEARLRKYPTSTTEVQPEAVCDGNPLGLCHFLQSLCGRALWQHTLLPKTAESEVSNQYASRSAKDKVLPRQRLKLPEEQTELPMADHAGNPTRGIAHRWLLCVWIVGFIGGLACGVWLEVWHSKNCRRSL